MTDEFEGIVREEHSSQKKIGSYLICNFCVMQKRRWERALSGK
jgi:hypothetical protein